MAATFRYATLDEYPAVSRFLDEHWAKDHIYCRSKALFDWTFRDHGQWEEDGYSVAVAEDQGELVGILGGIPFVLNAFGRKSKAVWIANYVIRPDHRRGTTALQLLSMFRRPPFQAVIAFGINPATSVIYRVLRGQVLPEIPRHFVVLPGAGERMVQLLTTAYPDWTRERALALAESLELKRLPESHVAFSDAIPPAWDQESAATFAAATVGAERSLQY